MKTLLVLATLPLLPWFVTRLVRQWLDQVPTVVLLAVVGLVLLGGSSAMGVAALEAARRLGRGGRDW